MFGKPDCSWISAWNELAVRLSTTDPTEVVASLVFVVQSPWAGLFVPKATAWPLLGTVEAEGGVVAWLLEQADTKAKVVSSKTEASAMDRRGSSRFSIQFQTIGLVFPSSLVA
jgi:hypothetical protein